ncbi:Mobile element protein [Candidatus Enterovibrio altilux]|uniref:Mobile element protein n=1 Tax=Candidatus Enterovibrio altilux TaxID=1927128 RepID=A0A291BBI2_9GAMM|nr:Mobile element protein [Candidatus Enterovibrio luxaltus]
MVRIKKFLRKTLSLRDQNAQMSETYAMIQALNKLTELSMPKTKMVA